MRIVASFLFIAFLGIASLPVRAVDLPDFTGLVEEASPAVVNISTVRSGCGRRTVGPVSSTGGTAGAVPPFLW